MFYPNILALSGNMQSNAVLLAVKGKLGSVHGRLTGAAWALFPSADRNRAPVQLSQEG